ncbi:uncharacterized protein N7479_001687 [Penicillium vulpinum]|uniref:uncharacterized protein n=1 Tax=Penicillium vulpinum TaxID=29845 RepID=UPI002548CE57|nr:uncharacterized protein N7479_001687 [Penicillium vulpinum]KAJ5971769.1 hypothetical protein N7479_001687 [Penicillium vulpinum]
MSFTFEVPLTLPHECIRPSDIPASHSDLTTECGIKAIRMPTEEDAVITVMYGLSVIPDTLTMEEAQVEMGIQMRMPASIARIALHDDIENAE